VLDFLKKGRPGIEHRMRLDMSFEGDHSGARVLCVRLFGRWAGGISSCWLHTGYIEEAEMGAYMIDRRALAIECVPSPHKTNVVLADQPPKLTSV
jgi:hypothetical protein